MAPLHPSPVDDGLVATKTPRGIAMELRFECTQNTIRTGGLSSGCPKWGPSSILFPNIYTQTRGFSHANFHSSLDRLGTNTVRGFASLKYTRKHCSADWLPLGSRDLRMNYHTELCNPRAQAL